MNNNETKTVSKGEPFVWLTSMGLSLGLVMIFCMLLLIFVKGITVFWPKELVTITLNEGASLEPMVNAIGPVPEGEQRVLGGEVVTKRKIMGREIDESTGEIAPAKEEWQLFVGNREVYGFSFIYMPAEVIGPIEKPANLMRLERLEWGDMVGYPKALIKREVVSEGDEVEYQEVQRISVDDPAFEEAFAFSVEQVDERRDQIKTIEKGRIGKINTKMDRLRIQERALDRNEREGLTIDPEERAQIQAQKEELQERYNVLKAEVDELRILQDKDHFLYEIPTGQERELSVGHIVEYYYPNQMGFIEKVSHFVRSFWRFMSEEPREANTEGGIFPAIFGTFVMTIMMSVLVTPFGVIAAIYLREYARQGPVVRLVRIAINNLAGVPSIVFGVFGLGFFVYIMGGTVDQLFFSDALPRPTFGTGGVLWASLTLALLTLPVVIVASEEALASVPRGAREGSLACGASQWQTIQRVILPASAPGILTGVILAMARGAGEVAPLMLVGVVKLAPSLPINTTYPFFHFEQKFMHLGFHIYDLGFQSPDSEAAKPMVFATTFLLIMLVVLMNIAAIRIRERLRRKYATGVF